MSVQTDSRSFLGTGCGLGRDWVARKWTGPIAAAVNMPQGSIGGCLLSDTNAMAPVLYPFVADGTMMALGFVHVGFDNSSGLLGARQIDVLSESGHIPDTNAGGANAITQADAYKPAFAADNGSCSKLASDGPCIGMILGIDPETLEPVILIDPVAAKAMSAASAARIMPLPIILAKLANAAVVARFTPGFSGRIVKITESVMDPATTAAKLATLTPAINGTGTTGGALALTSANQTPIGAKVDGSAITALNLFDGNDEITLVASSVTAFVEGQGIVYMHLLPL